MRVAAVDIGATSGRVIVADLTDGGPRLTKVNRFANRPVRSNDGDWLWPIDELYVQVQAGMQEAVRLGAVSWGIDTWAVDYGVIEPASGVRRLVKPGVRAYRDPRHDVGAAIVERAIDWPTLYEITGIQQLPFNTINQIAADDPQRITSGAIMQLVPDLLGAWATGELVCDATNASSTGMVDVRTRQWSTTVLDALGLPHSSFLPTSEPGEYRGNARDLGGLPLIGVATHDTASAFAGTPISRRDDALVLSLGTWALIGAEVVGAVPSPAAMALDLTHELGVDGTVRVLRNVSGMWLFEECRRAWAAQDGSEPVVDDLLAAAAAATAFTALFDIDTPGLTAPGQTPQSIAKHLDHIPAGWATQRGAVVRAILESLVIRLSRRADEIESHLGAPRTTLHVVGGASRNAMLLQWLADATGKRVIAGPAEATALGNALVQWRTLGAIDGLTQGRALIGLMPEITTYDPTGSRTEWLRAAARLEER